MIEYNIDDGTDSDCDNFPSPCEELKEKIWRRTRPKPVYGQQGLDWIVSPKYSFWVFSTWNHEKPWKPSWNHDKPTCNHKKNYENLPGTMKNHEKKQPGTIENHKNDLEHWKTNLEPWKTVKTNLASWKANLEP